LSALNLTRVAFLCERVEDIGLRQAPFAQALPDGRTVVQLSSARVPRRDLAGGSLYWIIRHQLVARQALVSVEEVVQEGKSIALLLLDPAIIRVAPSHHRAHQGWRYLPSERAPADMADGAGALPPTLAAKLAELSLL
jgi:hypothetical protein